MLRLRPDSVTVCLVADAQIARWNRAYRSKRGPTDVLSFPAGAWPSGAACPEWSLVPDGTGRSRGARSGRFGRGFPSASRRETPGGARYLGDIAIAPAVARSNARRFGRSFNTELRILILHGALHLVGYDHETDRGEMDRLERRLRRRLGLG